MYECDHCGMQKNTKLQQARKLVMDDKIDGRVGGTVRFYQIVAFIFDKVRLKSEAPSSPNDNVMLMSLMSVVESIQGVGELLLF